MEYGMASKELQLDVDFEEGKSLLVLTLTKDELQLEEAHSAMALCDIIELRASDGTISDEMVSLCKRPILFRANRADDPFPIGQEAPWMVDLPYDIDTIEEEIGLCRKRFPTSQLQISYHSENEFAVFDYFSSIEALLDRMACYPVDAIKCAIYPTSLDQTLTCLQIMQRQKGRWKGKKLTLIAMGSRYAFSRVLSYCFGSFLSFTSLPGRAKAAGQIDILSLLGDYQIKNISFFSSYYALIGSPVELSLSHTSHTKIFHEIFKNVSALYLKIELLPEECTEALFKKMNSLFLKGLSVTTPLKKQVAMLYGGDSTPMNTILFNQNNTVSVKNSDVEALKKAIELRIEYKSIQSVAILGYGDVAHAIVELLFSHAQKVHIYTRDETKKRSLHSHIECKSYTALDVIDSYDIIINTTSDVTGENLLSLFPVEKIAKKTLVAEFVYPQKSRWFQKIEALLDRDQSWMISGKEIWIKQAAKQFLFWSPSNDISEEMIELKIGELIKV